MRVSLGTRMFQHSTLTRATESPEVGRMVTYCQKMVFPDHSCCPHTNTTDNHNIVFVQLSL